MEKLDEAFFHPSTILTSARSLIPLLLLLMPPLSLLQDGCGSYSCRCQGAGYQPGPLRQSCVVSPGSGCPDPCSNQDPCNRYIQLQHFIETQIGTSFRAGNSANQCINQAQVQCGCFFMGMSLEPFLTMMCCQIL